MQYDLFISYSHHDNQTRGNWIHEFCDLLSNEFRSRTGRKPSIFLDRESVQTGNALSTKLKNALGNSTLFIPILSPVYLASEWCRREFLGFMEAAADDLILDDLARILPVRLMDYDGYLSDDDQIDEEVARILGFLTENEIVYNDFYRDPLPIPVNDEAFEKKIAGLSKEVLGHLKTIQAHFRRKGAKHQPAEAPALFLGYTAEGSKTLRSRLLRELKMQREYGEINCRILPDEAPDAPSDLKTLAAAELEAFLRGQLQQSLFSVHLFDDLEGLKTADTREPVAHLQYRMAKEQAAVQSEFSLFVATSITDQCSTAQEDFIKAVGEDARQISQLEILSHELKAIAETLLGRIASLKEEAEREADGLSPRGETCRVFLVHDHRDKEDPICARIDDLIFEQDCEVYVPVFREDDPEVDPDSSFRDFWWVCSKAIILLRHGTSPWCKAQRARLIKIATEKQAPGEIAVCVAEPEVEKRKQEVRSHEIPIIDCAQANYEREIVQFLKTARHA